MSDRLRPLSLERMAHRPRKGINHDAWFPEDLPIHGYKHYWRTVQALHTLSQMDAAERLDYEDMWLPMVAFFECTGRYDDASVNEILPLLSRPVAPPDLCIQALHVGIWDDPEDFWPSLLTKALPNACKVRLLHEKLSSWVVKRIDVYDAVLRILLHEFIGSMGGNAPPFSVRVMCYAALALYPPDAKQLARFVMTHRNLISFALRDYVLSMMDLTPFGTVMRSRYQWQAIRDGVSAGMDIIRSAITKRATHKLFLAEEWDDVERELFALNQSTKSLCFRAKRMPFHRQVLSDMRSIERKYIGGALPVRYISPQAELRLKDGPPVYANALAAAKAEYDSEQRLTGARRLLIGTERKPGGIFRTDRDAYEILAEHYEAVDRRSKIAWTYLPREWADLQSKHGKGTFMICPVCCEIRACPLVYPDGSNPRLRVKARFMQDVKVDMRTMQPQCAARDARHRDRIVRRRARTQRDDEVHTSGADIEVCHSTPLLQICMIGVLLKTERDGQLALCVDCGALLKFTPDCWTSNGPSCGCNLTQQRSYCAICQEDTVRPVRKHLLMTPAGCKQVLVCIAHHTQWVDKIPAMVTLASVRKAGNQRFIMVDGQPMFIPKK